MPPLQTLKPTFIPALILVLLALYPQLTLWTSGSTGGSYFVSNYDEPAYSAYVNSLVEGRPRTFDPFLQQNSEYESLYSVQAIPAYLIAMPARVFHLSTSTTFILLIVLLALVSYFALFAL